MADENKSPVLPPFMGGRRLENVSLQDIEAKAHKKHPKPECDKSKHNKCPLAYVTNYLSSTVSVVDIKRGKK